MGLAMIFFWLLSCPNIFVTGYLLLIFFFTLYLLPAMLCLPAPAMLISPTYLSVRTVDMQCHSFLRPFTVDLQSFAGAVYVFNFYRPIDCTLLKT